MSLWHTEYILYRLPFQHATTKTYTTPRSLMMCLRYYRIWDAVACAATASRTGAILAGRSLTNRGTCSSVLASYQGSFACPPCGGRCKQETDKERVEGLRANSPHLHAVPHNFYSTRTANWLIICLKWYFNNAKIYPTNDWLNIQNRTRTNNALALDSILWCAIAKFRMGVAGQGIIYTIWLHHCTQTYARTLLTVNAALLI